MRILHIINNLNSGGAEKLLVDTLPLYKNEGVELEVLQLSNGESVREYIDKLQKVGISVRHLDSESIYNPLKVLKLSRFFKTNRYDVIHVHLFPAMYWSALASKLSGIPTPMIFTEHSTQNKRFDKFYFRPIDRFIYGSYNKVIAISEAIGAKLKEWTQMPERIGIIRNGVNIKRFREATAYPVSYWQEMGIESNAIKLMMTARFSYPKDHLTVLNALELLPSNYYLIFTGEGNQLNEIKEKTKEKGLEPRVRFLGFRDDIPSLMKSVDLNILSSRYEGMSGVSLEAMASGKPFLGSDVSGINDVVPDQRYLFKAGDAQDLASKIDRTINNIEVCTQMINDGIQYSKSMDVMNTVNQYMTLYKALIKK